MSMWKALIRGSGESSPPPEGAPGAPSNLSLKAAGDVNVTVAWDRADDTDTSIVLERAPDSAGSPGTYLTVTLEQHGNVYADSSLNPATTYWYRVKAVNAAGSSSYSSAVSVTTEAFQGDTTPTIASVTPTVNSAWQITLAWTVPSWPNPFPSDPVYTYWNNGRYSIERTSDGGMTYVPINARTSAADDTAETFIDTPLEPNTVYNYRIRKISAYDYGPYTYSGTATTSTLGAFPALPTGLTALVNSATSTTLSWTDTNSGGATYRIDKATIPGGGTPATASFSEVTETAAGATSYALVTVANTPLYIRIRPKQSGNTSAYTAILTVRPASTGTGGTTYDIGPGQAVTTLGGLNWSLLGPGDLVNIHYATYAEKIALTRRGTAASGIRILGIADGMGNLPILTGQSATTNSQFVTSVFFEDISLIQVGKLAADPTGHQAGYVTIENLDLRFAHQENSPATYTAAGGTTRSYTDGAAGVYIARGDHITVKSCLVHDNSNGLFAAASEDSTREVSDITIEANYIYGNGTSGGFSQHNSYLEGQRVTYQYNRYGPLRATSQGGCIKDRSTDAVIRYNYIDGGTVRLDLVEAQNSFGVAYLQAGYRYAHVYGNVITVDANAVSTWPFNHGGDSLSDDYEYRRAVCYYAYNTYVIRVNNAASFRVYAFRLKQDNGAKAGIFDVRNSVFVVDADTGTDPEFYLLDTHGRVHFTGPSWVTPYADDVYAGGGTGIVTGVAHLLDATGNAPHFNDITSGDYRPGNNSPFINQTPAALPGSFPTAVNRQYVMHQSSTSRATGVNLGYSEI